MHRMCLKELMYQAVAACITEFVLQKRFILKLILNIADVSNSFYNTQNITLPVG